MRIISWNVNGIRAVYKKGFLDWFRKADTDIVCLQEIKAKPEQVPVDLQNIPGYFSYFNSATRPGYSGTAVFTKKKPISVEQGIGLKRFDEEGRVLKLKFPKFTLFNFYIPNGGRNEKDMESKLDSYEYLLDYLKQVEARPRPELGEGGPRILVGDFNVAHQEIDLARPRENKKNTGFTLPERKKIDELIKIGFIDSFREFYPNKTGAYTWWSHFANARARNIGWRIDYCFVSKNLKSKLKKAFILPKVMGSDHCPIGIDIYMSS
ncbi:MAG: exodeoxyribonuclease III [Parcubacteria group bacterium]|nr:exodeoxyribonuclease III [Parcubacteria group bacterium]